LSRVRFTAYSTTLLLSLSENFSAHAEPEKRPRTSPGEQSSAKRQHADAYIYDVDEDEDEERRVFRQYWDPNVLKDPKGSNANFFYGVKHVKGEIYIF